MGGICSGRPKRPPISTFDSGSVAVQGAAGDADQLRVFDRFGFVGELTMFSSFQISQWVIGR